MDKAITTYTSLDDMKADESREWQHLPAYERMNAVAELTLAVYQMKEPASDVRRLQRTLSIFNAHSVKYLIVGCRSPPTSKLTKMAMRVETYRFHATIRCPLIRLPHLPRPL